MDYIINGIQQVGIGVADAKQAFNWYREHLGFDILVFEDKAPASLMTQYTGGKVWKRQAYLSMNMQGGGGLEIWQYLGRKPIAQHTEFRLGDLGINLINLKTIFKDRHLHSQKDGFGNWFRTVFHDYTFSKNKVKNGGVLGVTLGVSNMQASVTFYQELFKFDRVIKDETGIFDDLSGIPGANSKFRRVVLSHSKRKIGGFGRLLGPCQLEFLQALDHEPQKIYKDRFWGDLGYIHLCFDIYGMEALKMKANRLGHQFTVDSANSFDMGKAAGRFGYLEDPDGTLIELVETHKVPLFKPLGLYFNLKDRDPEKPLPNWLVNAMRFHRKNKNLD